MKRQLKKEESLIVQHGWKYGKEGVNEKIRTALLKEQRYICAYTETFLGRTDSKDIEHFNPTLKDTDSDTYENWFVVKHQWNSEKSTKWDKFQPILHPCDEDFEKRVFYEDGYYDYNEGDIEAKNLIKLLKLDDLALAEERKNYLNALRADIESLGIDIEKRIHHLLKTNPNHVYFIRAIEEEFSITIKWEDTEEV